MSEPLLFVATSSAKSGVNTAVIWTPSFHPSLLCWQTTNRSQQKHRDHQLAGEWRDHGECHLKPDLLLIYRKPNSEVLQLVRPGTHSELFG